ncbi:ANTAR domain-containing protein [Streptomyces sp. Caat 7-52]|uniref:ANTAR domain-containing protein n=1 Tax=Streptomyces sp. Caat 7-52 TaxID=2949637 RepID=UPI00203549DA|nr:ANTAR domain-containing protein [Streptomyces sp. Caat 7-52]
MRGDLARQVSELQQHVEQLQEALVSHAVIDQAIGVVITLSGLRPDQGFEVLKTVSQNTNIKLREIAELIIEWVHTERLPDNIRQALQAALTVAGSTRTG